MRKIVRLLMVALLPAVFLVGLSAAPAKADAHGPRACYSYFGNDIRKMDYCIRNHFEGNVVRPHVDTHCYQRASVGSPWSDMRCQTQTVNIWAIYTYRDQITTYSPSHTAYDVIAATHHGINENSVGCGYSAAAFVVQVSFRTAAGTPFVQDPEGPTWGPASPRPC